MLQGAGAPKSSFDSLKNHSTKAQGFVISLTKELFFTQYSQSVLKAKNMNTKLLDGLEMFLGVCDVLERQQTSNGRGMAYI